MTFRLIKKKKKVDAVSVLKLMSGDCEGQKGGGGMHGQCLGDGSLTVRACRAFESLRTPGPVLKLVKEACGLERDSDY